MYRTNSNEPVWNHSNPRSLGKSLSVIIYNVNPEQFVWKHAETARNVWNILEHSGEPSTPASISRCFCLTFRRLTRQFLVGTLAQFDPSQTTYS